MRVHYLIPFICLWMTTAATALTTDELQAQYDAAVEDAETAEANEIYPYLTAIAPWNEKLQWREFNGRKQVLMVTWTKCEYYSGLQGKTVNTLSLPSSFETTSGNWRTRSEYKIPADIWVTAVPELEQFIRSLQIPASEIPLRIEQLLGLPFHNGKTCFVEFWVHPEDLFRPSPDNEITDSIAELDFPAETPDDYKSWFNYQKDNMYSAWKYPWTRLGYTYDWGNPQSHIGLSEFIIPKRADNPVYVEIHSITPNQEYFQRLSSLPIGEIY